MTSTSLSLSPLSDAAARRASLHRAGLSPVLAERRSTRAYDPAFELDEPTLTTLLEAARWAPSANNRQPWRFLVGRRGDDTFAGILAALKPGNAVWAGDAAALVVALAPKPEGDAASLKHTPYELGLAVGQLSVQAHLLGLAVRHMAGFEGDQLAEAFGVPADYDSYVVVAIGMPGAPERLSDTLRERELAPRERAPLTAIAFRTSWGQPAL